MRQVRLYDAWHSCLTYLANAGVPDHILAAWAGHTNATFTKRKYVRPDVEDLRAAATVWDSFHGGDPKAPPFGGTYETPVTLVSPAASPPSPSATLAAGCPGWSGP
ncbi:hypothetical protein [Streptomyces echinatus]|uniref:Integrase n=1 Tax=Streptomyces echinatus TaxID=67293 RepID=A0A7W9PRX3_9ACTN|nr:hypothetical protein [Streptomyces echinatus]MBB5926152.1 hypothetical protein [Streptomyces echinatus]